MVRDQGDRQTRPCNPATVSVGEHEIRRGAGKGPDVRLCRASARDAIEGDDRRQVTSKDLRRRAGVRTVPGYMAPDRGTPRSDGENLHQIRLTPVMIKPAASAAAARACASPWDRHRDTARRASASKNEAGKSFLPATTASSSREIVTQAADTSRSRCWPMRMATAFLPGRGGMLDPSAATRRSSKRRPQPLPRRRPTRRANGANRHARRAQGGGLQPAKGTGSEFIVDGERNFLLPQRMPTPRPSRRHPVHWELITGVDLVGVR